MAIKRVIDLEVNNGAAKTSIEDVKAYLNGTEQSAKSLRQAMREAQLEVAIVSEKFGATSKEAAEAAKKAALLKDQIGDARALTDAFNPDAKFNALTNSLSGAASGFAAVQGGMSLLGMQSEKTEEVLLKVQSAMALSQGLQGLGEARDSFKQLGAVAKNALSGIKTGIAATGIGVLLIALGAVVAYWDDISEAVSGVSSEQKQLNKDVESNLKSEQSKLDTIGEQDNILKLQGKSEKQILQLKINQTDEVIKATEAQMVATKNTTEAQIKIAQRNKDILKGILDFITTPIKSILYSIDLIGISLGKNFDLIGKFDSLLDSGAGLIFDSDKIREEGDKAYKEQEKALLKLKNQRAGYELQQRGGGGAKDDTAEKKLQKEIDDENKRQEAIDKLRADYILKKQELDAKEALDKIELDKQRALQELESLNATEAEKVELLNYYNQLLADESVRILNERITKESEAKQKQAEDDIERAKIVAEAEQKIRDAKMMAIEGGIGLLKTLAGKNKALQKASIIAESALAIHGIILNKQKADAGALAMSQTLPPVVSQAYLISQKVLNKVNAGIGIATTIAATAKALSQIGSGGSGGSAPTTSDNGGGGSSSAPQFNVVGNSGVNQIAQTIGQQQPIQAYVVANAVTTQQALDRNIINNASLG